MRAGGERAAGLAAIAAPTLARTIFSGYDASTGSKLRAARYDGPAAAGRRGLATIAHDAFVTGRGNRTPRQFEDGSGLR